MERINILIVEDEGIIAQSLKSMLINLQYNVVDIAANAVKAIEVIKTNKVDLAILDINIQGDKNGIWIGNYIQENNLFPFIYLTAYGNKQTIAEATLTRPSAYLLKPFNKTALMATIEVALCNFKHKTIARLNDKNRSALGEGEMIHIQESIFLKNDGAYVKLNVEDIVFVESDRNYINIYAQKDQYIARSTLKDFQHLLPQSFIQVHRSYLLNINKIDKIEADEIIIGSYKIPVGNAFKSNLFDKIKTI